MHMQTKENKMSTERDAATLTDFFWQHLQVGHSVVFKELDAVHTIKAVIFDHVEGAVHS